MRSEKALAGERVNTGHENNSRCDHEKVRKDAIKGH
jgi:hypothetical protein